MAEKPLYNYAIDPDENTMQQLRECFSHDFVKAAALMPDAHSGYAAPIGSVFITQGFVVPAWVGYDIGCGMTAVQLKGDNLLHKIKAKADKLFAAVQQKVPMGMGRVNDRKNVTEETKQAFEELVRTFREGPHDKDILQFIRNKAPGHLGSLGEGNHFIELGEDEEQGAWIVVHSGSRGIGYKVAEKYMKRSAGKEQQFEATYPIAIDSQIGREYLNVLSFGLSFALLNRMEMIKKTVLAIEEVLGEPVPYDLWVNKNHNHAIPWDNTSYIHRKGATPAEKGERGVIPANMRDGCFLVEGLGNPEFLKSSSHGAGRRYSRTEAKRRFSMQDFEKSMKGIVGTITEGTLDELPMAYKDAYAVMDAQKESVHVISRLRPIINWKGEHGRRHRDKHT